MNFFKKSRLHQECIYVYLLKNISTCLYTLIPISTLQNSFVLCSQLSTYLFPPSRFLSTFQPASRGYPANNTTAFCRFVPSVHFHSGTSLDQIYQMQTILHRTSRHSAKILFPAPLLCTLTDSFSTGCVPKLG